MALEVFDVPATDGTLVLGVLNGDQSAFAELYDRHARLVRAVCYDFTRDVDVAADLTQETFLRAYRKLGDLRAPQRFGGWLVGIARQVCREWRRGAMRNRHLLSALPLREEAEAGAAGPEEHIKALRDAIASLPEKERLALHAFYLQEMSVQQAGTVLGLSRSGLYRVLSSARKRLERVLTRSEVV
jgi:RNA polymerase sigma-70 factor (ECF subfamily)